MNIILILVDSLNKEALSCYNPETKCKTPNISALAERGVVHDGHFVGSLPCMPARRDIMAGRKEFMWRPWGPMEVFDPKLPREVQKQGYNTGMVTDHYHYWEETANGYMQGFQTLEMIRGHETDFYKLPSKGEVPAWVEKMSEYRSPYHMRQYYENVKDFKGEEDFFPAKTFSAAADWLSENSKDGPFFLHVETFDVHEPFHVPEPYASMYTDGIKGNADDHNIWPPYQIYDDLNAFMKQTTPEELAYLKSQYYGKVSMVDRWLGHFFDRMTELDLWDDTMVIFTTDHGHDLGERGAFGKQYPHYDSHANIPMLVWDPRHPGNGRKVNSLTQTVDIFSTVIEASGGTPPKGTRHSVSMEPVISQSGESRDCLVYGTFGQGVCITDGEWTLFKSPIDGEPLFSYSTMITRPLLVDNPIDGRVGAVPPQPVGHEKYDASVDYPMWKLPIKIDARTHEDFLFNRKADVDQADNLWSKEPAQRDRMLALLREKLAEEGCPPEQLARLGLNHDAVAA